MNLATEPWIPVTDSAGQPGLASLREVFAEGGSLRDLAVRPHERVALMRLLICIAQAALDGPADGEELETCGAELPAAAARYLEEKQGSFNLFHSEEPFLQFLGLAKPPKPAKKSRKPAAADEPEEEESSAVSKLDFALATGNNTTLFDHLAASDEARTFDAGHLALMLITFQCFSPGGRIGVARWRGSDTPGGGSSGHAPCAPSAMLHAFVRRGNLLETVRANLLTRESVRRSYGKDWGRPVWERMPQWFHDAEAVENATTTYLGRLMPLARAILLRPDGRGLLLANGLDYLTPPDFPPEPTASIVEKRDGSGRALVGAGSKALWRELPAIVVKRLAGETGGPLVLGDFTDEQPLDLWVGALLTDKASILDTVEGVHAIPARMLRDAGREAYDAEVKESERIAGKLSAACKTYRQHLEIKPQGYPEQSFALRRYWTGVEQHCLPLLHAFLGEIDGSDAAGAARALWRSGLWRGAREAFHAACANETPRHRRAHALALRSLQFSQRQPAEAAQPTAAS